MAFKWGNVAPLKDEIAGLEQAIQEEKQNGKVLSAQLTALSSALQQDITALHTGLVKLKVYSGMNAEQLKKEYEQRDVAGQLRLIENSLNDTAKIDDAMKKEIIRTLSLINNLLTFTSGKWIARLETTGVKAFGDTAGKIPELTAIFRNLNMKCDEHMTFLITAIKSTSQFKDVQPDKLADAVRDKEIQLIALAGEIVITCENLAKQYPPPNEFKELYEKLKQFVDQQTLLQADVARIRFALVPGRVDELKEEADKTRQALSAFLKKQKQVAPAGADVIARMLEQDIKEYFRRGIEMHEVMIEAAIQLHLVMDKSIPPDNLISSAETLAREGYNQHSTIARLQDDFLSKRFPHQNKMNEFTLFAEKIKAVQSLMIQGMSLISSRNDWQKCEINGACSRIRQIVMKEKGMEKVQKIEILQTMPNKLILFWDWIRFKDGNTPTPWDMAKHTYPCGVFFFLANNFPQPTGGITDPDALYAEFLKTLGISSLQELLPKK